MQDTGSLICNVYTSIAQIPIEQALVTVTTQDPGAPPRLLALRLTDRSGRTAPIDIATPPPSDSTAPGMPLGWTEVHISVDHPDYLRSRVEHVQIFPGRRTIQNLELIPLPEYSLRQNEQQQFSQPQQNL